MEAVRSIKIGRYYTDEEDFAAGLYFNTIIVVSLKAIFMRKLHTGIPSFSNYQLKACWLKKRGK